MHRYIWFLILLIPAICYGRGSLLLVGGGSENYNKWSDQPYGWFVRQADSGIIINIDVSEASDWYPAYFKWLGADSNSHELQISARSQANDSAVYQELLTANGIFIEGGDQYVYFTNWQGTLVEQAIMEIFARGGAIGGTSAGLAVLGSVDFDARSGSLGPKDAAWNPYHYRLTFNDTFLPLLTNVITDSHFQERGRLGRLVPMLARRIVDFNEDNIMGIGVDAYTAFCVDSNLIGTVYGNTTVTILYPTAASLIECQANQPLTFTDIHFTQMIAGCVYDLANRTLLQKPAYVNEPGPVPEPVSYQSVTLNGNDENTATAGTITIPNLTANKLDWYYGRLTQADGSGQIPRAIIIPKLFNHSDYIANRIMGGQYGLATHSWFSTIYLDDNSSITVNEEGILTAGGLVWILENNSARYLGIDAKKQPAIIDGMLHWLGHGESYDLKNHQFPTSTETDEQPRGTLDEPMPHFEVWPNPISDGATIHCRIATQQPVRITLRDLLAREIMQIIAQPDESGRIHFFQPCGSIPSGTYFFSLLRNERPIITIPRAIIH